jgi:uncharacterized membrane protein
LKALQPLCVGLLLAYPFCAHFGATRGHPEWGVVAIVAFVAVALRLAASSWGLWALLFAPIAVAALLLPAQSVLYAPPALFNLTLAAVFGVSLRSGAEPFIGRVARLERGERLDRRLGAYTRRLTLVWTVFFIAMAIISIVLAAAAPVETWSFFANGLAYLLIGALFLGEWLYRRVRLGQYRHAPPWELVRIIARAGLTARGRGA